MTSLKRFMCRFDNKYYFGVFLSIIVFLHSSLWIFQGIDFTDTGYHLTKQWLFFNGEAANQMNFIWGSSFIGGLWLSILPYNSLIWAHLGWMLLISLTALFSYLILQRYFSYKKVFFVLLCIVPFVNISSINIPHYFNIPAFFIILSIYFINLGLFSGKDTIYYLLAGLSCLIAVFCKLPTILFLGFPIIFIFYNLFFPKNKILWLEIYFKFILGFILGIGIVVLILGNFGLFDSYVKFLNETFIRGFLFNNFEKINPRHTSIQLTAHSVDYYKNVIFKSVIVLFLTNFVLKKIRNWKKIPIFFYFLYLFLAILFIITGLKYLSEAYYILIGFVFFATYLLLSYKLIKSTELIFLLLIALWIQIITPLGSAEGIYKTSYGLWLSLPIIFLAFDFIKKNVLRIPLIEFVLTYKKHILAIFLIIGICVNLGYVYRDRSRIYLISTTSKIPALKYKFSTPERIRAIEEIIAKVELLTDKKEKIMLVNGIPLIHFLTERKPAGEVWGMHLSNLSEYKIELQELLNNEPPRFIILSKGNTSDPEFLFSSESNLPRKTDREKIDYLKISIRNQYKVEWENKFFIIYKIKN